MILKTICHRNLKKSVYLAVLTAAISIDLRGADLVRCLTEAVADVEMTSIVPGTVSVIHFGEGSFVEKGEVIIELDSRTEQLDIDRRSVLVANLKATMERSELLLKNTSSISMEAVDEARSDYQIAVIELELARDSLDKKRIRAPFSGVVTNLPIEKGEYCEPPQILLRVVDIRQFYCTANTDPVAAMRLKVGDPVVYISENSYGDPSPIEGKIVFISPVLDSASGLLRIKAVFANPDGQVRPGEGGFLKLTPEG